MYKENVLLKSRPYFVDCMNIKNPTHIYNLNDLQVSILAENNLGMNVYNYEIWNFKNWSTICLKEVQ